MENKDDAGTANGGGQVGAVVKPFALSRGWWACKKCGAVFEDYTDPPRLHSCGPDDPLKTQLFYNEYSGQIICSFVDGEFDLTEDKWPLILAEREKKGEPLTGNDLRKLFK